MEAEDDGKAQKKGGKKVTRSRAAALLTVEQKVEIGNTEMEEVQKEIEETKNNSERLIDTLKVRWAWCCPPPAACSRHHGVRAGI
jgi:hypothetical protein